MVKVLVVEDSVPVQEKFAKALSDKVELLQAHTLWQGQMLFNEHKDDLAVIVMDACVPGDRPNSIGLIRLIRAEGFKGPMIAISSLYEYRMRLIEAGCSHECPKDSLPALLEGMLERQ